jgi:hypothetical protein
MDRMLRMVSQELQGPIGHPKKGGSSCIPPPTPERGLPELETAVQGEEDAGQLDGLPNQENAPFDTCNEALASL